MKYFLICVLLFCTWGLSGCTRLNTDYAVSRGPSINGLQVFTDILREQEYKVDVWPGLVSQLYEGYDVIIIFHKDFNKPDIDSLEMLSELMELGDVTKVVFIHRDLDLEAEYWKNIKEQLLSKDSEQAERASNMSLRKALELRSKLTVTYSPSDANFIAGNKISSSNGKVTSLITHSLDEEEESKDITKVICNFEIFREMDPPKNHQVIWETEKHQPILTANDGESFIVYNLPTAYPFLNGALIHPENRQLILELMKTINPSGKIAVVSDSSLTNMNDESSTWRFLKVFPHPWIAGQLLFFMILFCISRMPIFGKPLTVKNDDLKSFGTHVEALSELLRKSGRRSFALKLIKEWKKRYSIYRRRGKNND